MPLYVIIAYAVTAVICAFSAISLFARGEKRYFSSSLLTLLLFSAVFFSVWIFDISVPGYVMFISMFPVIGTCFFGDYMQLFIKSETFDRYLHALGAFAFSLLSYCILDDFVTEGGSRLYTAIFIFLLGNTIGVIFELVEMISDRKGEYPESQRGLADTDFDLLFNLIGSLISAAFAYFVLLR